MASKNQTALILKRLEEGTAAIYDRYESLIRKSGQGLKSQLQDLEADYTKAANQVSARSKIDLKNTLEKMADGGMVNSGETVQATIAANADRSRAMSTLAAQKAKDRNALEREYADDESQMKFQAEKEVSDFQNEVLKAAREQENADRDYELKQQQIDLQKDRLELDRETAAKNETAEEKEEGVKPSKSPYDLLSEIVKQNTRYNKKEGYKEVNRSEILKALSRVIHDTKISLSYRYELYLYGKSMGYIVPTE